MNPLMIGSKIFGAMIDTREALYAKNILPSYKVNVPVLSIGNLTFGGTGKTPTCDFLITNLKSKKKLAVLSRGYGRNTTGFFKVDARKENAAQLFGDEPTWLAQQHPDVNVYVCENRVEGCEQILKEQKVDLILADDAFQHLRLKRDFDIVVIDATEDLKNYEYPPLGRARNSWHYLKRANCVFLTKTNLVDSKTLKALKEKIGSLPVFQFNLQIESFTHINTGKKLAATEQDVFLMSGIGKPWTFENLVKKDFPFKIQKHFEFKDHYSYSEKTLRDIEAQVQKQPLLVTQKDAVKLAKIKTSLDIYVSELKMMPLSSMGAFYELMD